MGLMFDSSHGDWVSSKEYHDRRWFQYIAPMLGIVCIAIGSIFLIHIFASSWNALTIGFLVGLTVLFSYILRKLLSFLGYLAMIGVLVYMLFFNK